MRLEKPKSLLLQRNLVTMAKNAVGSRQFRNFYVEYEDGQLEDIFRHGHLSCASFVSNLLAGFGLIDGAHAMTESVVRALPGAGWTVVEGEPLPGDILVWEAIASDDNYNHPHIGIYVGDGKAVSNSESEGTPVEHDWLFDNKRAVAEKWRFDFDSWVGK